MKNLFVFILSILCCSLLSGQSVWERTFSKPNHNFQDYSVVVAKDGSNDLVLAGTLIDQNTNQHLIHLLKIDDVTASIIFEKTFNPGTDSWAMSICSFSGAAGSGYGVTGYTELLGVRYPIIITFDETGQEINNQIITTGTQNGMGLHIQATPAATNDGFVVVGLAHDAISSGLNSTQRQSFCLKVNQSLNLEWEKYFDSPLSSIYSNDYDGASFVVPTDQGYFITGGKNILNVIGQHRQGILALMLDANGNQLWDESFFLGNIFDNGASAYYDQNNQEVYVLFNNSAFHHLGIGVFDANLGTFNNATSIQASSSDFTLDKYGHTLIKTPFTDNLLIYGRAFDPVKGQPAFLVDYDISTKQFGVHHSESNTSSTLNQTPSTEPFPTAALRSLHYPQSLVNIDANYSAYISYVGDTNEPASLVVRKFEHLTEEEYNFCEPSDAILIDDTGNINRNVGTALDFDAITSNFSNQTISENIEATANAEFCSPPMDPSIEPFIKVVGDTLPNHYSTTKHIGGFIYTVGFSGTANSEDTRGIISKYDLTGNLLWTAQLNTPSSFNDIVETDNNFSDFLVVGRSEPVRVGSAWQDNQSIFCSIDANGNFNWINHYDQNNRENMTKIVRSPNPVDSNFPFYIAGVENTTNNPSTADYVNVFNVNSAGNINWKKQYFLDSDNEFIRDVLPLSNGGLALFGNHSGPIGNVMTINGNGTVKTNETFDINFAYYFRGAIEIAGTNDYYVIGEQQNSHAFIARLDRQGNEMWSFKMDTQIRFTKIDQAANGDLYVVGLGTVDGISRYMVNKFSPNGQYQWTRYIDKGEQEYLNGCLDVMPEGNLVYSDCRRDHPNGFGDYDVLLGVFDLEMSSECTVDFIDNVIDSFFLNNSLVSVSVENLETFPTQISEGNMVELNCAEGCEELIQIDTFLKLAGDTLSNRPTRIKRVGDYLYVTGTIGTSPNVSGTFSQFDLSGNLNWTVSLDTASVLVDFVPMDDDGNAFLVVGRSEPIGNGGGNNWQDNESILCAITNLGVVSWVENFTQNGREFFTRIVRSTDPNPPTPNPNAPFYIIGAENPFNPNSLDRTVVINVDANGQVIWKNHYYTFNNDTELYKDAIPLANGDIALFGDYRNNAGSAYVGGAMVITPNGALVAGQNFGITNSQYINTAVEVNGSTDFLIAGEDVSTGQAFLGRVTNTGTSVWALTVANQQSFRTVKEGTDGNIYVLGRSRALFGEIPRNYMNCFTVDAMGTPTLNWTRHIDADPAETAYSLGYFDILQEGKIAYVDGRINNPVGAGDYDILLSVSSLDFNDSPCMRDTVETFTVFNFASDNPNTVVTADMPNTNMMGQGITLDYQCATPCGVTPPLPCEIICPDDITVNNDPGMCSANVTLTPPTLTGDCTGVTLVSAPFITDFPVGCTNATWTYQFPNGFQKVCTIQVCVIDNEDPFVTCTDITAPVGNGSFTVISSWIGTAFDNCPNTTVTIDQNTFDCSQRNTIVPVVLTATDASGNVSQCTSQVTVVDLVEPTLDCLPDITVNCDVDYNDPNNTGGYPFANDICDPNPVVSFVDNISIGDPCNIVIQRDWTATDDSGNVSATCTQMINVIDGTPPVVTNCPTDITVQVVQDMNGTCVSNMMLPLPTVVDDCSNWSINFTMVGASTNSGQYVGNNLNFFEGTTTVTLTAFDDCGNSTFACQYDVTVECVAFCPNNVVQNGDFEMGTPISPSDDEDINLATNWGGIWNINNPSPPPNEFSTGDFYNTTSLTPPSQVATPAPQSQSQFGAFWVGNGGDPVFREGIMNQLAFPLVQGNDVCQLEFQIACLAGFGSPTLNVYGVSAPNGFNSGTITSATMPTNPNIFGNNPVYFLTSHQIDPTTCDNNFMTVTLNFNSSVLPPGGIDHIFFTRADATQGSQYIAIDDVCLAKVDDCVADFNWNIIDDCGTIQFTDASTSATNIVSWNYYEQQTNIFNVTGQNPLVNLVLSGNYTVCLDIVTASGCTSTLCQSFDVPIDKTDPVITCPTDATISCNQNPDPILTGSATATDDFDLFPTITYLDNFSIGDPCDILIKRTWTATDACGNSSICIQDIHVIDDIAPKFVSCTADIVVQGTGSLTQPCMATVSVPNPIAKDGCSPNSQIVYTYVLSDAISGSGTGPIVNMDFPVGTTTITWTATDACGNAVEICTSHVIVNPCEECTISCPENITVDSEVDKCDAFVNVPSPTLTGDCFGCEWTNDYNGTSDASDTYPVGCTTVIFSTTNCPNNLPLSCSVTICVEDNQDPQIDCPDDITVQATSTTGSVVTWLPIFGSDNCPLVVDCSMNSGDFFPCGTTTVTCTITEFYTGNTTTCSFNVTVICVNNTCSPCPDNILTNGDFQDGAVVGSMGSITGAGVNNWSQNTVSPQVIGNDFCGDPFSIQMWGNQDLGESMIQNGVNIKAGYKYRISFCARYLPQNLPTNYVQFGFTASNGSTNPFNVANTAPNFMGASTVGQITSPAWACYTLPLWTADQDYTDVIVHAFNGVANIPFNDTTVSWGRIDNICIEELDICTLDCPDDILVNNDPGQCGAMVTVPLPDLLGDCSGCGIFNDFNGNDDASGFYPVGCTNVTWSLICASTPLIAQCSAEICVTDNEPPGPPCPADITVTVPFGSTGDNVNYFIPVSDNCPGVGVVNQTPAPSQSGDFFPLGCTTINLQSIDASLNTTPCSFDICVVEGMPPCPSDCSTFQADVDAGYFPPTITYGNNCIRTFIPKQLGPCDQVEWIITGSDGSTLNASSTGNDPVVFTLDDGVVYKVRMIVIRTLPDGTVCQPNPYEYFDSYYLAVCIPFYNCTASGVLENSDFQNGLADWEVTGTPEHNDGMGCDDEGYVILSGNKDEADIISQDVSDLMSSDQYDFLISVCLNPDESTLKPGTRLIVRTSDAALTSVDCGNDCDIIGIIDIGNGGGGDDFVAQDPMFTKYMFNSISLHIENDEDDDGTPASRSEVAIDNICIEPILTISTNDISFSYDVNIFPNPTSENVFIDFSEVLEDDLNYRVIDMWGRVLQDGVFEKGYPTHTVKMKDYAEGIYIIEMGNGETGFYRERIVKHTP